MSACDPVRSPPVLRAPRGRRRRPAEPRWRGARLSRVPPREVKTCSNTSAASGSSPGSTRSRLDTNVTGTPSSRVAARELRPGDAGSDDDQPLGQGGEVVDVAPGQNPFTIGLRRGEYPRRGPGAEQHDVGFEDLQPI